MPVSSSTPPQFAANACLRTSSLLWATREGIAKGRRAFVPICSSLKIRFNFALVLVFFGEGIFVAVFVDTPSQVWAPAFPRLAKRFRIFTPLVGSENSRARA